MLSSIVRLHDNQFIMRQGGREEEGSQYLQSFTITSSLFFSPSISYKSMHTCRLSGGPGGRFLAKPTGSGTGGAWGWWSEPTWGKEPWVRSGRVSTIHQTSSECPQSDSALDCPEHHGEDDHPDRLDSTDCSKPGTFPQAIIDPTVRKENFSRVPAPEKGIICHYCQQ